jgi:ribosomal protein L17
MRHGKKFNHLSRKNGHRKALLRNLTISLVKYKIIKTTIAKAKELRKFIEPLLTKSKNNTTHSRRVVYSYLQNKEAVTELSTYKPNESVSAQNLKELTQEFTLFYGWGLCDERPYELIKENNPTEN